MMEQLKIYNGRVVLSDRVIPNGVVVVKDGRISYVGEGDHSVPGAVQIDAGGGTSPRDL
jgi:imidazolonepropionase-like amidohydrolase